MESQDKECTEYQREGQGRGRHYTERKEKVPKKKSENEKASLSNVGERYKEAA